MAPPEYIAHKCYQNRLLASLARTDKTLPAYGKKRKGNMKKKKEDVPCT
jgi:hypothetical protein